MALPKLCLCLYFYICLCPRNFFLIFLHFGVPPSIDKLACLTVQFGFMNRGTAMLSNFSAKQCSWGCSETGAISTIEWICMRSHLGRVAGPGAPKILARTRFDPLIFWKAGGFVPNEACKPQSYASLKLQPTHPLTGVKCWATSEDKKWVNLFVTLDSTNSSMEDSWWKVKYCKNFANDF